MNLGASEIVVILVAAFFLLVLPVAVVLVLVSRNQRRASTPISSAGDLAAENQRLREEIARLKGQQGTTRS